MKKLSLLLVLPFLLAACNLKPAANNQPSATPITQGNSTPILVTMTEQNKSGQNGTATLTESNGQVTVTINVAAGVSAPQPAHLHVGSCPTPGAVQYPLANVVNGKSSTTINTTLAALSKLGPLAVNIHKSPQQLADYTSCGNLPATGGAQQ